MRNTKNAFTLVELIVVITILAVLGTIAFVSLQGYSRDAKNSKVTSDIRTLVSAIETKLTDGGLTLGGLVGNDSTGANTANKLTSGTVGSGAVTLAVGATQYKVGTVDFVALGQNWDDFKDNDGHSYVAATIASGSVAYYQVAGQTTEASGDVTPVIKGNYIKQGSDVNSLVTSATPSTALVSGTSVAATAGLY